MAIVDSRNWTEMLKEHSTFVQSLRRDRLEVEAQNWVGQIRNIKELSDDTLRELVHVRKRWYEFPPHPVKPQPHLTSGVKLDHK